MHSPIKLLTSESNSIEETRLTEITKFQHIVSRFRLNHGHKSNFYKRNYSILLKDLHNVYSMFRKFQISEASTKYHEHFAQLHIHKLINNLDIIDSPEHIHSSNMKLNKYKTVI